MYVERIDSLIQAPATLYLYGSAACILLDEPDRTSLDIDVAGPYSQADERDIRRAAESAGIPVNPGDDYAGDHIEWVGPLRLCLQPPQEGAGMTLWQGAKLCLKTGSVADLVASKLIRYDETDQTDIRYLLSQSPTPYADIVAATKRLPVSFSRDPLVTENLANLRVDMAIWGVSCDD